MSVVAPPLEVFYSFAEADEPLREELEKHLALLRHEKLITTWHSRQVSPGQDLSEALDSHLNSASVILLLVSADFLASNYCYGVEMRRAMERHHSAQPARVIPILLRPVDAWQRTPFGQLQPLPANGVPITQWPDRDEAFSQVAAGIRAALEDLERLTVGTPSTSFPPVWEAPYPPNQFFTGREEILQRLAETLKPGQPAALSQPQAISGLGGIGKTQLALEYAYRYRTSYQAVFWTLADTRESLIVGYVALARRLNLPQQDAQDQMLTV
ncbi:MAG: TIR domain-containing protein [Ktedonobacteraceae bacterium]|nr:TIR domain-containing protein [Ktedonobacteraceae bacterium]